MKKRRTAAPVILSGVLTLAMTLLTGCSGSEAGYTAIYQLVPDAHVLYLGNHLYLAKDTGGNIFLIKMNEFDEVATMDKLF